tara:strand:+ start:255 stop:1616 length:1362 start_codon:yes stop_codon:yes gene_type:complete
MAVSIDTQNYFPSGEISFQDLKNTFGGGGDANGKNVKFSNFIRNTTDTETPLVPDSTENSDITDSKNNLSMETFRNSNKSYDVTVTGTVEQEEVNDTPTYFNNNLTKNIPKKLNIGGEGVSGTAAQLVSGDSNVYAAKVTAGNVRNMSMNVNENGAIYGAQGSIGGGTGGGALDLNVGSASRNFNFSIKGDNTTFGKVWAGGGGGPSGTSYPGRSVYCNYTAVTYSYRGAFVPARCTHYPTAHGSTEERRGQGRGCGGKFRGAGIPADSGLWRYSGGPMRGWNSHSSRGGGGTCYNHYNWTRDAYTHCSPSPNRSDLDASYSAQPQRTQSAAAGIGGPGGKGQGWFGGVTGQIKPAEAGTVGSGGGSASCNNLRYYYHGGLTASGNSKAGTRANWGGSPNSTHVPTGGDGLPGGSWGEDSGGPGGTAIKHPGTGNITFNNTGNDKKLKGKFSA